jgi:HlyD family secretion protein
MDVVRTKQNKKFNYKKVSIAGLTILLAALLAFNLANNSGTYVVDKDTLLIDTVQRGVFNVSVRGTGVLVPTDIRWVATNVEGRVERILVKAGAQVKAGDLLMQLTNPQLLQRLEETKWQQEEMLAQTKAQQVALESLLLDQQAAVINEKLNHQSAQLTLNAQNKLLSQGVVAVSQIDHAEVKIQVAQYKQYWQLAIKRLDKMHENVAAQRAAYQAKLNRMKRIVQRAQQQVDALNVTASMDSIVQVMPMELGQQVNIGTNLARLAKSGEFFAELRIPEKQIQDVALGQKVMLDTRSSKIQGIVKRVDPAVVNGSVQVDIELLGELPREARPELTIDGVIEIAHISDTLFVKRPMFAKSFDSTNIYLVHGDGASASQTAVNFGQVSTKYIQIQAGLNVGDSIIVSDASNWQNQQKIKFN